MMALAAFLVRQAPSCDGSIALLEWRPIAETAAFALGVWRDANEAPAPLPCYCASTP